MTKKELKEDMQHFYTLKNRQLLDDYGMGLEAAEQRTRAMEMGEGSVVEEVAYILGKRSMLGSYIDLLVEDSIEELNIGGIEGRASK